MSYISARTHPQAIAAELVRLREINAEMLAALKAAVDPACLDSYDKCVAAIATAEGK